MRTAQSDDTVPGLAPLTVDHDADYVLGFPIHIGITIGCDQTGSTIRKLPDADYLHSNGAVGLELVGAGTAGVPIIVEPAAVVQRDLGLPTFDLKASQTRRILVDLSELLPEELPAGSYLATVSYGEVLVRTCSPPFTIVLRSPNPEERLMLGQLRSERERLGSWGEWTIEPPPDAADLSGPIVKNDPLRFNRLVRSLFYGSPDLLAKDLSILSAFSGVYTPEIAALQAEWLMLRAQLAESASQAKVVRQKYPGLSWWADEIIAGQSTIAWMRSMR